MFERFTDRARRVIVLAQEHSRLLHHNYIGTEHILLGVTASEGDVPTLLAELGIDTEYVKAQVLSIIGVGGSSPSGHIPFTPRAKKVIELSLREALQLGHNYIGIEHLVLGLIREGEGVAAQVMESKTELMRVRQRVIEYLNKDDDSPADSEVKPVKITYEIETEILTQALRAYNMMCRHLGPGPNYIAEFFDSIRKRRNKNIVVPRTDTIVRVAQWLDAIRNTANIPQDHPFTKLRYALASFQVITEDD